MRLGENARRFFKAPQTVLSLVSAVIEPGLIVLVLYGLHVLHDVPFDRQATVAALMVVTLTFPGRNRLSDPPMDVARDIVASWAGVLAMLLLFAYVARSVDEIDRTMFVEWTLITPVAHCRCGSRNTHLAALLIFDGFALPERQPDGAALNTRLRSRCRLTRAAAQAEFEAGG